MKRKKNNYKICIIGQGFVGFDLAMTFIKKYPVIGYDKKNKVVNLIKEKIKKNEKIVAEKKDYHITNNTKEIIDVNVYIVTVDTPVDDKKNPNYKNLIDATHLVAKRISKGNIIIFESTVYPGLTEEICIPILENESKLALNKDFYVGYSPERVNEGLKSKNSNEIVKVTSGSNKKSSQIIDSLYRSVIDAGTCNVSSIKIAEATKLLENCQRDVNIALMNEYYKLMRGLNIDMREILEAAKTKWNFSNYFPGLVGGNCIPVDPYYLIYKAKKNNLEVPLIELARNLNEDMLSFVYKTIIKKIKSKCIKCPRILFVGITYKEESKDYKSSLYYKLAKKLSEKYNISIADSCLKSIGTNIIFIKNNEIKFSLYNVIIIGTPHQSIKKINIEKKICKKSLIIDISGNVTNDSYTIF